MWAWNFFKNFKIQINEIKRIFLNILRENYLKQLQILVMYSNTFSNDLAHLSFRQFFSNNKKRKDINFEEWFPKCIEHIKFLPEFLPDQSIILKIVCKDKKYKNLFVKRFFQEAKRWDIITSPLSKFEIES